MRRILIGLIFSWFGLCAVAGWAGQGDVIEPVGNGQIHWSQGIIMAKGNGAPPKETKSVSQARLMAERAALTDARRNLLEVLKGVQVDSVTLVEKFMAKNDQIRLQVEGFIQGSTELKERRRYLSDGSIEVTVAMNLNGDFLALMLHPPTEPIGPKPPVADKPADRPISKVPLRVAPGPATAPSSITEKKEQPPASLPKPKTEEKPALEKKPIPQPKTEEKPVSEQKSLPPLADLPQYTGLVVDAHGLNMKAALLPKILEGSDRELYKGEYVPSDKVAQNGLVLYSRDLTAAQTNPRVGKNPLTVKGFKVNPNSPSDIILSTEEAKRVAPFSRKGSFLEECKVMIVVD